jgi:hypothetical protein
MDRFVTLDRLPAGFVIPRDLADKLQYDGATRRLSFHGYMSKTDFDRLSAQTKDWGFRRKLEELFQSCAYKDQPEAKGGRLAGFFKRLGVG